MKLRELKEQIDRLLAEDEYRSEANVVFGPEEGDHIAIEGGIIGAQTGTGLIVLILAPIKLDKVGGF
jgi:hypothetical protein